MTRYERITIPSRGEKITVRDGVPEVPDQPIVSFIEGDGVGRDVWKAARRVFDAAVESVYGSKRRIHWMEIYAGEKASRVYGEGVWIPDETFDAIREHVVAIKGPLTTPAIGDLRSLNVMLRQVLNLYACVRPVRHIAGVPSPNVRAHELNVIIFRENTEDVYAGVEFESGSPEAERLVELLRNEFGSTQIRDGSAIGIKPVSEKGSKRLVRKAIRWAIDRNLPSVTLMHKGNIMRFTEGAFRTWGYEVATGEFRDHVITEAELWDERLAGDGVTPVEEKGLYAHLRDGRAAGDAGGRVVIKDCIADTMFQQIQTHPGEHSVICTLNLNGDYISDAAAAMVGGRGLAPSANVGNGIALFDAAHGTAVKYADKDVINPSSALLSGCMMFEYMGWNPVSESIFRAIEKTIAQKRVTFDLHRQMEGATRIGTSEYASAVIGNLD